MRGVPCQGLAPQQLSFEADDFVPASPNADDAAALDEIEEYEEHLAQVERDALSRYDASESSEPAVDPPQPPPPQEAEAIPIGSPRRRDATTQAANSLLYQELALKARHFV